MGGKGKGEIYHVAYSPNYPDFISGYIFHSDVILIVFYLEKFVNQVFIKDPTQPLLMATNKDDAE